MDTIIIRKWPQSDNHFARYLCTIVLIQGLYLDHQILEGSGYNNTKNMKLIPDIKKKSKQI